MQMTDPDEQQTTHATEVRVTVSILVLFLGAPPMIKMGCLMGLFV
jgi:hypothetical protein